MDATVQLGTDEPQKSRLVLRRDATGLPRGLRPAAQPSGDPGSREDRGERRCSGDV